MSLYRKSLILATIAVLLSPPAPAHAADASPPGVNAAGLEALKQRIVSGELPNVHSVLVLRGGQTIAEWYFAGTDEVRGRPRGHVTFDAASLHDARSITKGVVSMLVGIAIAEGKIKSLDDPTLSYFPEYPPLGTPERQRIRLRDLMSMTSGLKWDENTYPYTDARNSETAMDMAADRNRFVLEQEILSAPGERWQYSGGDVALMGAILARATGRPLEGYAREKLFAPMGITSWEWLKDNRGVPYAASGLRLTTRDMGKLGQMMLAGGRWEGRQIVPADWAAASVTAHASVQPDPVCGTKYGYFWWLSAGCSPLGQTPWFAAIGNGGQRIYVVPSRDLVVITTAGLYNDPRQRQVAPGLFTAVLEAVLKAP